MSDIDVFFSCIYLKSLLILCNEELRVMVDQTLKVSEITVEMEIVILLTLVALTIIVIVNTKYQRLDETGYILNK